MKTFFSKFTQTLQDSYYIAVKDLLELIRDKMMVVSFVIMPIFMMIMTGYVFPSENILKNIPVGIINLDRGDWGKEVEQQLGQIELSPAGQKPFVLVATENVAKAKKQIQAQEIHGAMVIPEDFSARITSGEQSAITIITDESNPQLSAMLSGVLGKALDSFSAWVGAQKVKMLVPDTSHPEALVKPVIIQTEGIIGGKSNYFEFMAPGVMTMVVIMAVLMGLGASIAREKESGTLDGILVSPVSRLAIILGKTLSQAVRGLLQGAVVLLLAILLFGVVIHGSILLVIFLLLLGVFSFIGLGVLISALASRQETAITILMTLYFPMLFLSGAFFPVQQMPVVMQSVAKLLPLTYAVQALRKIIILGAGIPAVMPEVLILVSFGVVTLLIAIPAFNRVITR